MDSTDDKNVLLEVIKGGPLKVSGVVKLVDGDDKETMTKKTTFLCRCGTSKSQPYCDGSHKECNFEKD